FSATYWHRLLGSLGESVTRFAALRAYYVSQMGKYLPGKAWALLLRVALIRGPAVRTSVATFSVFYEVLTTMASGTLVALILFLILAPGTSTGLDLDSLWRVIRLQELATHRLDRTILVLLALALLAPVGIPLLPPVFNRLVHHLSLPF